MNKVPQYKNVFHGIVCIVRTEGLKGIYQGVLATVAKQGSNQAIRFSVFNPLKNYFSDGDPKKDIGVVRTFLCGGLAGAASVFGNTPVDVIKSRLQSIGARERYRSTWHCVQETWAEGGVKAYYKGTTPRLARVVLNVALTFTIFDQMMKVFDKLLPG